MALLSESIESSVNLHKQIRLKRRDRDMMKGSGNAVIMHLQKRAQKSIHAMDLMAQFYKDVFLLYVRCIFAKFVNGDREIHGIMPPCIYKTEGKREVRLRIRAHR